MQQDTKTEKKFVARFDDGSSFEFELNPDATSETAVKFAEAWNEMAGSKASLLMVEDA